MIHLSTNEIQLKSSPEELFSFLSSLDGIQQVLDYKRVRHMKNEGEYIQFILKRAALFQFKIAEKSPQHVQIHTLKNSPVTTAIQFNFKSSDNGSSLIIHFETDTTQVIDFTFEKKVKEWISHMIENLEARFN